MREMEEDRVSKGTSDRRTPWAYRDLGAGLGWRRGGNRMRYGRHRLAQVTPCGRPERKVSTDKRWRPAVGGTIQVDVCSAPGRFGGGGGGGNGCNKRSKQH